MNKRKQQFRESTRRRGRFIATQSLGYDSSEEDEVGLGQCTTHSSDEEYDKEDEEQIMYVDSLQHSSGMGDPVYEGSSITIRNAMLMILYFVISCNLSVAYVDKLLVLLHYLLPGDSKLKQTKYLFFKYFNNSVTDMKHYHACHRCRKLVVDTIVCSECGETIDCHFLAQKPSELLINKFQDREYWNKCQYFIDQFEYKPIFMTVLHTKE